MWLLIEIEAWDNMMKKYQELLVDMCEHKLAPNSPYVKSFFGPLELLKKSISGEHDLCKGKIEKRMRLSTMSDGSGDAGGAADRVLNQLLTEMDEMYGIMTPKMVTSLNCGDGAGPVEIKFIRQQIM
nr:DNA-directed RNA polymerase 1B, mitochondrial [Tanacetum cinerariifolium]